MSLVGTRPILQDELLKYELHHRAKRNLWYERSSNHCKKAVENC